VASALDYAHRRGVAHGALTADCIIVDANEMGPGRRLRHAGLLDAAPMVPAPTSRRPVRISARWRRSRTSA